MTCRLIRRTWVTNPDRRLYTFYSCNDKESDMRNKQSIFLWRVPNVYVGNPVLEALASRVEGKQGSVNCNSPRLFPNLE